MATEALAGSGSLGNYTSSQKPKRVEQRRTIGSGSRSNCHNKLPKNSITLLVPEAEVAHKTSLTRPSFFVKSNLTKKTPLKFTLVNPQVAKPIVEVNLSLLQKGITKIDLPQPIKLEPEKIYLWYVAIPCQNSHNNNQSQEVLSSSVKLSPLSPTMRNQLQSIDTDLEAAMFYAQNGFWYEALNLSVQNNSDFLQKLLFSFNFKD
ncbi:MAG: DUF928 domain-containing protein [Waterburya sp.]